MTGKQRDELLAKMTDEVAHLVLRNNILQVQAISLAEARPEALLDRQAAFLRRLEVNGRLNRELELLPDEEKLAARRQSGLGLYRPEIALLLAYAKMTLYEQLMGTNLPEDDYLQRDLIKYFPRPLRKTFAEQIKGHRLRREITATLIANSIVNRGLGEIVGELAEQTGYPTATIARSYIVTRDVFGLLPLFGLLETLAGEIGAGRQIELLTETRDALIQGTRWFLHNLTKPIDIKVSVDRFYPGVARLLGSLDDVLGDDRRERLNRSIKTYETSGLDQRTARRLATLPCLTPACDIVAVADDVVMDVIDVAKVYFAMDAALGLHVLLDLLQRTKSRNHWEGLAIAGLKDDVAAQHRRLTVRALKSGRVETGEKMSAAGAYASVASWLTDDLGGFARWQRLLADMESQGTLDLAMLSVAVRMLAGLESHSASA